MSSTVISVENLSKSYRLGQIGTGTLTNDLKVWWAKKRGLPNPLLKIGQTDHGNRDGETLWALRDVSFTVQQGEVLGIIGRNGAGKSTLLKILSRVTAPTSGCVKVKGRIASLLEVGTGFHPELTGRENIYLNGAILGMSRQEITRKFDEIVAFAEVEKFIDTPVKRYSSGMYVRLAFAVAAHLESEILLVDEVLAVGDAEFQKKCLGKMGDVASQEGRTVLFVSHNMAAVENITNSAVLIQNGVITEQGKSKDVISKYLKNTYYPVLLTKDLSHRTDRFGSGIIKATHISLYDLSGNPIDTISTGETVDCIISFSARKGLYFRFLDMGINCYTVDGTRVFTNSTKYSMVNLSGELLENNQIKVRLYNLPLSQGEYTITLDIRYQMEHVDTIENALIFYVVNREDITNRIQGKNLQNGIVLLKDEWELL